MDVTTLTVPPNSLDWDCAGMEYRPREGPLETYLLAWNPRKYPWGSLEDELKRSAKTAPHGCAGVSGTVAASSPETACS